MTPAPQLLLLNGPNLGRLGRRRPELYGTTTLEDIERRVADEVAGAGWEVVSVQRDCEGMLIAALHDRDYVAAIVNPGALMVHGWSLRDALEDLDAPWVEVHLTNVWAREEFRQCSVTATHAVGVIMGLGPMGYVLGARALVEAVSGAGPAAR